MQSSKILTLLALLAGGAIVASAQTSLSQNKCPIDPSKTPLEFSSVTSTCKAADDVCSTCVCSLVDVFTPALVAAGVTYDADKPEAFDIAAATGIIRSCAEQYMVAMMMANVDVTALARLNTCEFDGDEKVPACLTTEVSQITAANVTATSRVEGAEDLPADNVSNITLPATTGTPVALRVATVQATPAGPEFTLSGELSSAGQLLAAMAASPELLAAMTPEAAAQLQALAAAPAAIDTNPGTAAVLSALENPVDGASLLSQMVTLNGSVSPAAAGEAAAPAAAPAAPAPAPTSSAAARGMTATATVGAALLAAMLL